MRDVIVSALRANLSSLLEGDKIGSIAAAAHTAFSAELPLPQRLEAMNNTLLAELNNCGLRTLDARRARGYVLGRVKSAMARVQETTGGAT